ncbi:hypothetical protein SNE40_015133 [Patella caerulea]|uniref:Uncharacterized protein n=1 Tax=Patella caerulea TaxID=87958 RepID=A0AAN8JLJ5_PATCE
MPLVWSKSSVADDIDAPPSPPPPQLISFELRSFSSSEDEDNYLFISNKRSRVASIESEEEEASADDNDFVPPTPPPVISTPSPPSAIAPPSPMAPASPPPALVPSSEPFSSYVPVHGRRAFAPFHIIQLAWFCKCLGNRPPHGSSPVCKRGDIGFKYLASLGSSLLDCTFLAGGSYLFQYSAEYFL